MRNVSKMTYQMLLAAGAAFLLMAVQLTVAEQQPPGNLSYIEVPLGRTQLEHVEWIQFLSENLEPDFQYWRKRAPLKSADILAARNATLTSLYIPAVLQLVLIYNNKLYWPNRPDINGGEPTREWASWYNEAFHRRLVKVLASGRLKLPNVLFIYNTDDNAPRLNSAARNLPVPMLSVIKSLGLEGGDDLDILVPQMYNVHNSLFLYPWHLKQDKAYFRGIGFCSNVWRERYGYPDACARLYLSHLTVRDQQLGNGTALDCGLVEEFVHYPPKEANPAVPGGLPVLPRVPFGDHARHKWLLSLEGVTASNRFGQLFMVNSVTLFQRSPYIEYFYRSLRPWHHYVPFWNATAPDGRPLGMDDVYGTLAELRRMEAERPDDLQRIVKTANEFAIKYLTPHARWQYYAAVLNAYKALFADMDSFIERYVEELRAQGWNIE